MDRRTFLRRFGVGASALAMSDLLAGCGRGVVKSVARSSKQSTKTKSGVIDVDGLPVADWLVDENRRAGTLEWTINPNSQIGRRPIEGYADRTSVTHGEELSIYVNTTAHTWHAEVFRMGFYQGRGARLIERTKEFPGRVQPNSTFTPVINMVSCSWLPSYRFVVSDAWPPGNYLVRLDASSGARHYIPVTVRDDTSHAAIVMQNSVTTWQAYNLWGGYSLYGGNPIGSLSEYDSRSRVVSFDRPYFHNLDAGGSGDWLGNEFPFLYFAERLGLDMTYLTNVDLDARPNLLKNHRVLVSLGHDEYWSHGMRYGVQSEMLKGLNVAFLGANACYRQIRFAASKLGERREVICYKDYLADPVYAKTPWLATGVSWATTPHQTPESQFVGAMYQDYGASGDLEVFDPGAFVFRGMDLRRGDHVPKIIGSEFDAYEPQICPANVQILAHSPTQGVVGFSDMTYYTTPHGGGVFDSGTAEYVSNLWDGVGELPSRLSFGVTKAAAPLAKITANLLSVFANGPAAHSMPSKPNWQTIYNASEPLKLGIDVS